MTGELMGVDHRQAPSLESKTGLQPACLTKNGMQGGGRGGRQGCRGRAHAPQDHNTKKELSFRFFKSTTGLLLLAERRPSKQHTSLPQGRIFSDNWTCCHTKTEVSNQLAVSPSHSMLTPVQLAPALIL